MAVRKSVEQGAAEGHLVDVIEPGTTTPTRACGAVEPLPSRRRKWVSAMTSAPMPVLAAPGVGHPGGGQRHCRRDVGQSQFAPVGSQRGQGRHCGRVGGVHHCSGHQPSMGGVAARDRGLGQMASAEHAGEPACGPVDPLVGQVAENDLRRDQQHGAPQNSNSDQRASHVKPGSARSRGQTAGVGETRIGQSDPLGDGTKRPALLACLVRPDRGTPPRWCSATHPPPDE